MQRLFVVSLVAYAVLAVVVPSDPTIAAKFAAFRQKYNKNYTPEEATLRLQIFEQNVKRAAELQSASKTAKFGITKFSDLSQEEFAKFYLGFKAPTVKPEWSTYPTFSDEEISALPASWDWRTKGAVTPVKNQGQCGSCWSFSSTGNIEGQWAIAGNTLVGLSEQNLVDCDHECMEYEGEQSCDAGCDGGLMPNAFHYVMSKNGIDTESSYPYLAYDNTCAFNAANIGASIKNWTYVSHNETQMAATLVAQGPISVAVDANMWQFYIGGIFDIEFCGSSLDHGVLVVGYATGESILGEVPYWIIKNSWDADWGEQGYIYMRQGKGMCGINDFPCTSYIKLAKEF